MEKSPWNKKSLEYPVWFYTKLFPEKSPFTVKMLGNRDCLQKKGQLILNISLALFNMQMHNKSTFYENLLNLTLFWQLDKTLFLFFSLYIFFRTLISVILFSLYYLIRKSPRNLKLYFLGLQKIGTFLPKFLFPHFFIQKLFSCDFT